MQEAHRVILEGLENQSVELQLLYDMINNSEDMIFILRIDDAFIEYCNETAYEKLGYTLNELHEMGIEGFRRPMNESEPFLTHLDRLKSAEKLTDYAYLIKKDGTEFPIEVNAKFIHQNGVDYNIAIVRDISERVDAQNKLASLNSQLEEMVASQTQELEKNIAFLESYKHALDEGNIVSKSDVYGHITYVNDNFCKVSGYTKREVIGRPHNIVRDPETPPEVFKEMWKTIQSKQVWRGILKNRKKNGEAYWVDIIVLPILDEHGDIYEYIGVRHEISELVKQRKQLLHTLTTDALTQLGNRHKLLEDIKAAESPSMTLINLDNFREINDFYGHAFGDLLLQSVGKMIKSMIKQDPTKELYRLHADEFAILNKDQVKASCIKNLDDMLKVIEAQNFMIEGEEISVQLTSSVSFESDDLLVTADMALKHAKRKRLHFLVYNKKLNLNAEYAHNIKWTKKLRTAIDNDKLVPFFQPIVHNETGEWQKYESLVRMIDEEDKVISPFFFLNIAKRTNFYETLTQTMIRKSIEAFKSSGKNFSINLTIKDIMSKQIKHYIYDMLNRYEVGPQLIFEIVESEGIESYDKVVDFISIVKSYGCKIAIDDFGSGYSNFNYLLEFKADFIKIDGSLIKHLDIDRSARVLVETIVGFAKKLGMETIAEYVENETIYTIVKEIGIDYSQGYYFSEPKAEPDFTK